MHEYEKIRKSFKTSDDARDAGLVTPAGIRRFDDIPYGPDRDWQVLDVYRPASTGSAPLPVIVSVHGGGWVYGTKETYQFYCMDLARRGFAVVNFTYRLAPEHKLPASLEDTCAVFGWVLENSEKYGFDTGRVFAVGDSAGGHILSLFCSMCADPEYARLYPFAPPERFMPAAVAINCGALHHEPPADPMISSLISEALPGGTAEEFALVDAVSHVSSAFPPVFLMTSVGDFLKNDAILMARSLVDVRVPFELHYYGDSENDLGHVFHVNIRNPDGVRCNDDECAFFRAHC